MFIGIEDSSSTSNSGLGLSRECPQPDIGRRWTATTSVDWARSLCRGVPVVGGPATRKTTRDTLDDSPNSGRDIHLLRSDREKSQDDATMANEATTDPTLWLNLCTVYELCSEQSTELKQRLVKSLADNGLENNWGSRLNSDFKL